MSLVSMQWQLQKNHCCAVASRINNPASLITLATNTLVRVSSVPRRRKKENCEGNKEENKKN